jgi:hypothetical protein
LTRHRTRGDGDIGGRFACYPIEWVIANNGEW